MCSKIIPTRAYRALANVFPFFRGIGFGAGTASFEGKTVAKKILSLRKRTSPLFERICVFDIGCQEGRWTLAFVESISRILKGVPLQLHLFDPLFDERAFRKSLEGYEAINSVEDYKGNNFLVSSSEDLLAFDLRGSRIILPSDLENYEARSNPDTQESDYEISVKQFSSKPFWKYLEELRIVKNSLDLWVIKIDVEGHEFEVLKSMKEYLNSIDVIQFEISPFWIDNNVRIEEVLELFSDDFELFSICPKGMYQWLERSAVTSDYRVTNFVLVRQSRFRPNLAS